MVDLSDPLRSGLVLGSLLSLGYFVLANSVQTLLMLSATLELRSRARRGWGEDVHRLLGSDAAPAISVVAPAYNEADTIAESVRSLLTLRYPLLQVVVVNDGSTDGTLAALARRFDLAPVPTVLSGSLPSASVRGLYRSRTASQLLVVDKENGGKADALNAGTNVATGDLVCAVDADTLLEADALLKVVRPFLGRDDVVAAGGTIRVVNGSPVRAGRVVRVRVPRTPLAGLQTVEYLRAFLFGRLGWNRLGGNIIVSGAFGLFHRDSLHQVGGYLRETVGEDIELVVRLRRHGVETGGRSVTVFVPDPVAWTEVPESISVLARQRDRWQRGLADVMWRHRDVVGRPRHGAFSCFVYPYFVIVELLGPVIEVVGLLTLPLALGLGAVDGSFALMFLLASYGWGLPVSLAAVLLDELTEHRPKQWRDRALLVLWAALENLGYRQLTMLWRLRGLVRHVRGAREWGAMTRRGFESEPT